MTHCETQKDFEIFSRWNEVPCLWSQTFTSICW